MEKVYYTVQDVKDFLGTLGFEWHGFCFTNENGVTLEAEEKIENFMIKENIDVFDTRPKGKYFAQLSVMSDEYDYDVRNDYFLFINDMSFVLRSTQYLSILDDFCEKENNYNLTYFDHNRGRVAKIKRQYFAEYESFGFDFLSSSPFSYYDLSEEWVNYIAKKYPQTYFPRKNTNEIEGSYLGCKGLDNITELCEKAIKYRDIDLSKPNAFIKDFENHPEDYVLALKKYTTPKSFRKSLVRKRTPELKVEMKEEIKTETNDMTM